jgi:eukaryotic-like serine/threonine-protein kinase
VQLITDLVGRTLSGRYHLAARLAGGHLGEVYGARDELLDRPVAVKALNPALALDEAVVDRFRHEAQTAARLSHENAVSVYDWGEDGGTYYMVMEHIPGTDLRDLLVMHGSLPAGQAVEIVAQVCDALGAAHAKGLVHKDLKPENILIDHAGTVKVSDFGIGAVTGLEEITSSGMTAAVRYVSPEQALGFEPSATSDVWAAGAILAETLTGRLPLQGAGTALLERRAHEQPVPPSKVDSRVPRDLDDIVLKACALDPAKRYFDGSEMAGALRRAAVRSVPDAPPLRSLLSDAVELDIPKAEPTPFVKEETTGRHSEPRLRLRLGRILLVTILLALLGFGTYRGVSYVSAPVEVAVPRVLAKDISDARETLSDQGLEVSIVAGRFHREAPKGEVLAQTPEGGMLVEGGQVNLIVSKGPPHVSVPKLANSMLSMARTRVRGYGLELGRVIERYSDKRRGTVLKQIPDSSEMRWGTTLHLVVSKGPPPVKVPQVAGMSRADARRVLKKKGLRVEFIEAYSDTVAPGFILYTDPENGVTRREGDKIKAIVSIGPEFEEVTVPNLTGMSVANATAQLEALGLNATVFQSCKKGGDVADTDPGAGSTVRETDTVTLVVC